MKTIEFTTKLEASKIVYPEKIAKKIQGSVGQNARVILLVEDPYHSEDQSFKNLVEEQFLKGYSENDAIYDSL